jgi:transcription termination/antitermination protein NusA
VPNDQLSLAIGRKGQNVRLASKLVGWEIDVRSKEGLEEEAKEIAQLKSVGKKFSAMLVDMGYETITQLSNADPAEIAKQKKGIGPKKAAQIVQEAKDKLSGKDTVKEEKKADVVADESAQAEPEVKEDLPETDEPTAQE